MAAMNMTSLKRLPIAVAFAVAISATAHAEPRKPDDLGKNSVHWNQVKLMCRGTNDKELHKELQVACGHFVLGFIASMSVTDWIYHNKEPQCLDALNWGDLTDKVIKRIRASDDAADSAGGLGLWWGHPKLFVIIHEESGCPPRQKRAPQR